MTTPPAPAAVGSRLAGRLIAVSVSSADDLAQLGHPAGQLLRALQALLVPLVADGARIGYGGRITATGENYTIAISNQLAEAYRRLERTPGNRPFVHFLAQHRLKATAVQQLCEHLKLLAPYGEVWVRRPSGDSATLAAANSQSDRMAACQGCGLREDAHIMEGDGPGWLGSLPLYQEFASTHAPEDATSYTAMRSHMATSCDARVMVGGRKTKFAGPISGLCEEALLTIAAGKPLYVLGGFGGASRDIAVELGLLGPSERVPRAAHEDEARYAEGLWQIHEARAQFEALISPVQHSALKALAATESVLSASELLLKQLATDDPPAGSS